MANTHDYTDLPLEDQLFAIKKERAKIKERDEELKLLLRIVERELGDKMVNDGIAFMERAGGSTIRMSQHTSVKPSGDRAEAARWLRDQPIFRDLAKLNFDSRSLSTVVEQIKKEGGELPAEFDEYFEQKPYYKITTNRI